MNDEDKIILIRNWVPQFEIFPSYWADEWTTRLPMIGLMDIPAHHDDYSTALDNALHKTQRRILQLVKNVEERKAYDKR